MIKYIYKYYFAIYYFIALFHSIVVEIRRLLDGCNCEEFVSFKY
jgi:hypothetical protein